MFSALPAVQIAASGPRVSRASRVCGGSGTDFVGRRQDLFHDR